MTDSVRTSSQPERRVLRQPRVPSAFVAHGSPMTVMDREFAAALGKFFRRHRQVKALLVVSAHWQVDGAIRVSSSPRPKLLYDFSGFPGWLYEVGYPCPGEPSLAQYAAIRLEQAGLEARLDPDRGLDHGVWVPLSLAYPEARIPVVQVSLPSPATPDRLLAMGRALAPLRYGGVMLVGTGGITHNLALLDPESPPGMVEPWAEEFDLWVHERVRQLDADALADAAQKAPHMRLAAPSSEHLDPLLFVMGTAMPGDSLRDIYAGFRFGSLSLRSFALVGRRREDRGER
ncbi:MAG: class III extradiol ring-cleavage dioxygenase [Acidobacteriota bacterium]